MSRTWIKGGTLYTMTDEKGIYKGDILVEEGKIKKIAKHMTEEETKDARVIDA